MNKLFIKGSIALLPLLLLLFSCTDDKLNAGLEILPESGQLEASADTLPIKCFTYKGLPGSAIGTSATTSNYPIGHVFDEIFGETTAEAAIELSYNSSDYYGHDSVSLGDVANSLKLYLNITDLDYYGENKAFDAIVYLLNNRYTYTGNTVQAPPADLYDNQDSKVDTTIHNVRITSNEIAQLDSGDTYIVIELENSLAITLMDSLIYNTTDFYNTLPGISLRGKRKVGTIGGLQSFNPASSKLILEYTRPGIALNGNDTTLYSSFDFAKFQFTYRNDHTGREAKIDSIYGDTINQFDKFYLQGLGGTRGIIKFDYLRKFKEKYGNTVGINLAELVLPIHQESLADTNQFGLPKRISVQGLSPNFTILHDDLINAYYFNGYLDKENFVYRVNLSEYVNKFMLEDLEYILLNVTTAEYNPTANSTIDYKTPARVVLNSGSESDDIAEGDAYIRIIYTLIYD